MSKKKTFPFYKPSVFYHRRFVLTFLFISAAAIPLYFICYSYFQNKGSGLPFDDAFIHLTFARNITEYGAFSFFKNEMSTSGSSSPLYTFILALGSSFFNNEFFLCYFTGILFFGFSSIVFFKIIRLEYGSNNIYIIATAAIFVLDKHMIFFSVSGMETILFILILLASLYFYRTSKAVPLALSLGLTIWTRPEGALFILAIIADYISCRFYLKVNSKTGSEKFNGREKKQIAFILSVLMITYIFFNLLLSDTILPNTFYAKSIFYSPEFMSREIFLENDVWDYFTSGSYSFFFIGFMISSVKIIYDLLNRKRNNNFIHYLFLMTVISAYWLKMPYSGLNGRYFVPLIPFYLIISFAGFITLFNYLNKFIPIGIYFNSVKYISFLLMIYLISNDLNSERNLYANSCRTNQLTHINAANWIKNNTRPGDIIATHEIGAIGFYAQRKIIDIAGIITPELIKSLSDENYILIMQKYLDKRGVNYFATMNNWCIVDNNNPLFNSGIDQPKSEYFEIFKYIPDSTHILSKKVSRSVTIAKYNLYKKNNYQALCILNEAAESDSASALIYFLMAEANSRIGDTANTELNLLKAVKLFPDYPAANLQLCNFYKTKNDFVNKIKYNNRYEQIEKILNSSDNHYSGIAGKEAQYIAK